MSGSVSIGDGKLHLEQRGDGAPVLLVHGFPLDYTMWQGQLDGLSDRWRVIAPDLRGFGKSSPATGTLTMAQMADDLAALLDALKVSGPIALCGLSMGGYVAFEFWKRHRPRLSRLILCDTRAAADSPEAAANRHTLADKVLAQGAQVAADAMLPKLFGPEAESRKPNVVESVRQTILQTTPSTIAAALRGMAVRADFTKQLGQIDVPTLVICGQHDRISPVEEMRSIAQAIPDARFAEIAGVGHMAPLEDSARVNAELRAFLED